jgi:hypothetical protein
MQAVEVLLMNSTTLAIAILAEFVFAIWIGSVFVDWWIGKQ